MLNRFAPQGFKIHQSLDLDEVTTKRNFTYIKVENSKVDFLMIQSELEGADGTDVLRIAKCIYLRHCK